MDNLACNLQLAPGDPRGQVTHTPRVPLGVVGPIQAHAIEACLRDLSETRVAYDTKTGAFCGPELA